MATVHFITPTDLPLDAFTTFGVNHKPNTDSPIGYFGTGLKYVVAIVARQKVTSLAGCWPGSRWATRSATTATLHSLP